jgi:aspartate/methionine/tyrosine aminotransferase
VLLLSDECYADLYEGDPPPSVLEAAGEGSSGVLSYLSLSKRSGMTGYRSGAFIGDPEAVAALAQLRASVGVASAEFVQAAAVEAWSDDDHAAERRAIFARKRAILAEAFEAMGFEVAGSEAGIYQWVVVDDDAAMAEKLLADGIVVSPGSSFGPGGEGHLRLALVPTVSECAEAVEVLQRCLKS